MRIVVVGGAGDLGSRVVRDVTTRGHDAVSASRRTGVDIATGQGLQAALVDADAVVNCADDTSRGDTVTVYAARRLADTAADLGVHLAHISIVGIDDHPMTYYRRKLRAEQGIAAAGGPATILRATQFHSLAAFFARTLTLGPLTATIGDMALQPVDTDFVAQRLVDLALAPPPTGCTRATDVAGPDVLTIGELATLVRAHRGASAPHVVRIPPVGRLMRAVSESRTVPVAGTADLGGRTFEEWLAAQPPRLTGR
jgi:uncharacterized protein YbjT (DUF2867 family)